MSSREQQILDEMAARIDGAPLGPIQRPAGLAVSRSRMLELKPTQLPHVSVYPLDGTSERKGSTAESTLTAKVAIWAKATPGGVVDAELDPIWLWVHQQLLADESLGGLVITLRQPQRVYGFAQHLGPFGDLDLHYLLTYRHSAADPSRP